MKPSYKLNTIMTLGLVLLIGTVSHAFVIAVPHDANMVQQANLIVSGVIDFDDANEPVISVDKIFKGDFNINENLGLKLEKPIWAFSLGGFLKPYHGKKVIVLGKYNKPEKILVLPWYVGSIWPYGTKGQKESYFPSETYKECEEFLIALLAYREMGKKDKDTLIGKLLDDVNLPGKRCAVLSYSGEMLSKALGDKELEKQFYAALLAEVVTNNFTDPCTVNNVAYLSPRMPPSICATYFLNVSKQKNNKSSKLAFSRAKSILRIRRMIKKGEVKNPAQLESVMKEKLGPLELMDAKKALKIYDSKNQRLRQSADKIIMLALRDEEKPGDSIKDKKAFWQRKIQQKEDARQKISK